MPEPRTEIVTTTWKELRGKIIITYDMKRSLLTANRITYRIYSGTNPITFEIEPEDVLKIKKLFLTDGSDIR
jgi:hypothetical protein